MNKLTTNIFFVVVSIIYLFSCRVTENKPDQKHLSKEVLNKDSYQAGDDWKLVWSDEFNEDVIDGSNWNF